MPLSDDTTTGNFTDYTGTVTDAWFATDAQSKRPDELQLFLKFETDDVDNPEWTERYSCGVGWVTEDNGETAVLYAKSGEVAKKQKWNERWSSYAHFIKGVVKAAREAGKLDDIDAWDSKKARTWVGTRWHMSAIDLGYAHKETGQWRPFMVNVPDEWVSAGQAGSTVAGNGKVDAGVAEVVAGLDDGLRDTLTALAQKSASFSGWQDMVLADVEVVRTDRDLRRKVGTAKVWEALRAGAGA
jgi:hypothetical protein